MTRTKFGAILLLLVPFGGLMAKDTLPETTVEGLQRVPAAGFSLPTH